MTAAERAEKLIFTDGEISEKQRELLRGIENLISERMVSLISAQLCLVNNAPIDSVPEELEYIVVELIIRRFNRIGSEGLERESISGHDASYDMRDDFDAYKDDITSWINMQKDDPDQMTVRFL